MCVPYEVPPNIPEHNPLKLQTKQIHVIIQTFSPNLLASTLTPHPCHLHISTGQHQSSMCTLTFLSSRCSNHLHLPCLTTTATLWTPKTVQTLISLSVLQRHSTHPSPHYMLRPLQTMQIFSPQTVRMGNNSVNWAQAHLTLALADSSPFPPAPSVSPK